MMGSRGLMLALVAAPLLAMASGGGLSDQEVQRWMQTRLAVHAGRAAPLLGRYRIGRSLDCENQNDEVKRPVLLQPKPNRIYSRLAICSGEGQVLLAIQPEP